MRENVSALVADAVGQPVNDEFELTDLDAGSLGELLEEIGTQFNIATPQGEVANIRRVKDIFALVEELLRIDDYVAS